LLTLPNWLLANPKKVLMDLVMSFLGSDCEGLVFGWRKKKPSFFQSAIVDVGPPVARAPPSCFATFCLLGYNLCKSVKVLPSSGKLPLSVALHSFMLLLGNCRGTKVYIQFAFVSYETRGIELNTSNLVF